MDGQIWALKADSLTSPLIVTVTVTVTDKGRSAETSSTVKLIDLQNTQFGAIGRPENPLFGAEIFVMSRIQAELNTNFLLKFSNFLLLWQQGWV